MNKRSQLFRLISPGLLSMCVAACSDDGSGGGDTSNESPSEAGVDTTIDSVAEAGTDTHSTGSASRSTSSSSTRTSTSSNGSNSELSSVDASTPLDATDSPGETSDPETETATETTAESTTLVDASQGVPEIEDPTSEEVPAAEGTFWEQLFWQGHVNAIGETTAITVEDGQLCFSGNESGTVGIWYNVNQPEGAVEQPFMPVITGVNLDLATVGEYELHFYANDTLYCSGVIDESFTFFLWASFRECDNLLSFYDAQTPLTTMRFTYLADGEFNVCINRLDSGRAPDAGVPSLDGGTFVDAAGATDAALTVDASTTADAAVADAGTL